MTGFTNRGRPATVINGGEVAIWNERFAVVHHHATGYALVHDALGVDGPYRFITFTQKFGAKARAWLESPARREYFSDLGWASAHADAPPVGAEARAIAPTAETRVSRVDARR